MGRDKWMRKGGTGVKPGLERMMGCLCSGEQIRTDEVTPSSDPVAPRDYSASVYSSRTGEAEQRPDAANIEEAESSLREFSGLNYEEARALLGKLEYQKGNIESALHVFEGIDIAAATPKMKLSIARRVEKRELYSNNDDTPLMSKHAVSLLSEAIFLKSKSLQVLGNFREAAQSCKVILDTVESALPEGLPENFGTDCKLQETLNKAVELLPELCKLAGLSHEAILSYRRALLRRWNLGVETTARIQKEFAIFLLYSGCDASPPNLRSQIEGSFVPRNNIEEAVLLLMILLRKFALKRIEWDPSIMDHLSFALSVSGELRALANQLEELLPGILDRKERYYILALCYHGVGEDMVALNLLRKLLSSRENPNSLPGLFLASKICGEDPNCAEEGVGFARRALGLLQGGCDTMGSVANCLLGVSLSAEARAVVSDSQRIMKESEALKALETAERTMRERDPKVLFHLSLENAEQRRLNIALYYAKQLLKLEDDSNVKGWLLLARILSAQQRYKDAETVINIALDQTGKWDQGNLLRTKAKLQIAQGQLRNAVETCTHLLAVLQVQNKSFIAGKKLQKDGGKHDRSLEIEIWHDLANVYMSTSQWRDAEVCLSKSRAISPRSASHCHATGLLNEAKGLYKEALEAFTGALEIEPTHVPSLVSTATVLRRLGDKSAAVVKSFLFDALRLDRTNASAWYNLGLLYKAEVGGSAQEAAECFQTATLLEDSAPVEPFR
ncbi:protein NPGR2-like isoform X2 [Macadamia integrifolia]|uniref:protein NPGR2-like isoform X1 n=1 Tax=Macadamia integrifolia TaxID=60698 RepID=UPI001C4E9669|nr:protein NPGR2-like isoform X1 [Macadamia integrifolia]XP_042516701.1 protein NPGR2-like isoform X1 [Macadamia integrifolia]XP_042516702.1 protein NPGR2-like isoform X1 [Macadamia integrifolia]XP_042516704.1 protein NPGR2-like isoform X1 [Macadamia integrifolia]XP_042516705.1 protein NPGR2-like isoform X2 [Macadamia integrifolia]